MAFGPDGWSFYNLKALWRVDDEDLLILLSRLKELEEAYRWEYSFLWMM